MELPKNITQVGESDQRCKVYAEDYVISYIKQMNRQAEGKNIAIALYGIRKEEENISYIFFYGAAKVNSIQKEVRHLSQAQSQEVEKLKKRFFPEYQFMGYRLLDGDMIEGFHVCDQGTCRYISGYACFYEKNDAMLAYMLDSRKEEVPPETVDQEKFDRVRQRQEERRAQYRSSVAGTTSRKEESERREDYAGAQEGVYTGSRERTYIRGREGIRAASQRGTRSGSRESGRIRGWNASRIKSGNSSEKAGSVPRQTKPQATPSLRMMRAAVAGIFILLCVLGITSAKDMGSTEDIQAAARQLIAEFTEKKIPDASEEADNANQSDTLVAEDKLTDAIQQENAAKQSEESAKQSEQSESSQASQQIDQTAQSTQPSQPEQTEGGQASQQTDQAAQSTQPSQSEGSQSAQQTDQAAQSTQPSQSEQTEQSTQTGQSAQTTDTQPDQQTTQSADSQSAQQSSQAASEQTTQQSVSQQASTPVTYTIKKGDTLTAISIAQYGTDEMVQAICDLNQIKDPDDIRFGQKILLP